MDDRRLDEIFSNARSGALAAPYGLADAVIARINESPGLRRALFLAAVVASAGAMVVSGLVSRQVARDITESRPPVQELFSPGGGLIDAS